MMVRVDPVSSTAIQTGIGPESCEMRVGSFVDGSDGERIDVAGSLDKIKTASTAWEE